MNEKDISILDWLITKIKSPGTWFWRDVESNSQDAQSPAESEEINASPNQVEPGQAALADARSTEEGLIQIDISFTMPAGSTIELKVTSAQDTENPSVDVTGNPLPKNLQAAAESYTGKTSGKRLIPPSSKPLTPFEFDKLRNIRGDIPIVGLFIVLSLILYLFTRFGGLDRFPAFFFSDEAMQSIYAEQLIENHFISANDKNIPVYVPVEGNRWSPMATIYIQAIPVLIFGKSVFQTKATSIIVGFLGVIAVALILKLIFKLKYWWTAILFMAIIPAWFLHSRTAFETVMATAFFAIFLLFYLLYRYRAPGYVYGAIFFGALTFYSYSNSQALMGLTILGLFFSDWRYHLSKWKYLLGGVLLSAILLIPFIIFQMKIPDALEMHLRAINSYWYQQISTQEKILTFFKNYLTGLSPQYWFLANSKDLIRHRMIGYGHIPLWSLPLVISGIVLSIRYIKESSYRAIIIAALAAPAGASMLEISIARTLAFIVPVTIFAILGLDWFLNWAGKKIKPLALATGTFVAFAAISLITMNDAVTNGPLWTNIYGLYGLQYGAVQIFEETLPSYVADPNTRYITVTPIWANATDRFVYFFFTPKEYQNRIFVDGIDTYLLRKQDLIVNDLFVWTAEEYKKALDSKKFKTLDIEEIIPYPNGEPGFYVLRMQYTDDIDSIFVAEKEARSRPVEEDIELDGKPVHVAYSRIDGGALSNIFDGDPHTLMRALEANPMIVEMDFLEPKSIAGLDLTTATMEDFTVTIKLFEDVSSEPVIYKDNFKGLPSDPTTSYDFDQGPSLVKKIRLEIEYHTLEDPTHIHIREISLR